MYHSTPPTDSKLPISNTYEPSMNSGKASLIRFYYDVQDYTLCGMPISADYLIIRTQLCIIHLHSTRIAFPITFPTCVAQ
jgi:hypothetical protein